MGAMLTLMAVAVLTLNAVPADPPPPPARSDAPAIVPLLLSGDRHCLPDASLCFGVVADAEADGAPGRYRLQLTDPASATEPGEYLPLSYTDEGRGSVDLWPFAIQLPSVQAGGTGQSDWLVGIVQETRTMYSGGGGQAARLHLHRLGIAAHGVRLGDAMLSLPWRASLSIRACFSEADNERRLGVCHDEYNFGANLTLAASDGWSGEFPPLHYQTQTTAYPQTARRGEDSSAAAPLTAADLSLWRDPECSYTRTLRFNPASERYEMDRTAPDCSAYTVP